jgi:hypothetical protein
VIAKPVNVGAAEIATLGCLVRDTNVNRHLVRARAAMRQVRCGDPPAPDFPNEPPGSFGPARHANGPGNRAFRG